MCSSQLISRRLARRLALARRRRRRRLLAGLLSGLFPGLAGSICVPARSRLGARRLASALLLAFRRRWHRCRRLPHKAGAVDGDAPPLAIHKVVGGWHAAACCLLHGRCSSVRL